ncbi:MAG TPA: trypsin-like peptidase domain-containing protein [Lachnospiraceae bacterium]|nr:trypsin-like peptidase domain-containing protein [Lachnospiraceae bacterium]
MDEHGNILDDQSEEVSAEDSTSEGGTDKEKDFEFITETIKEKPINKKRILGKILLTLFLAVMFGLVAGLVFLLSQKYLDPVINPVEPQKVEVAQEEEEPEEPVAEEPAAPAEPAPEQIVTQIVEKVEKVDLEIDDYKILSEKLHGVATEAGKSMVTVTGLSSDMDWFMNSYENENQTSGLIVADNGKELLILAHKNVIENAESIQVTFCDGTEVAATNKKVDPNTGLAIVAVELSEISEETMNAITQATFGNTKSSSIIGIPVIAVGNPLGYAESVGTGYITSNSYVVDMVDTSIKLVTTDIYGSKAGSGVIINLDGKVLGIVCLENFGTDENNLLKAYAISDIITVIDKLLNGQDIAYLGIKGTDVTEKISEEQGVPIGAYVTEVIMDSPAMQEGIQSGDVIVKMGTMDILSFADYRAAMMKSQPGDLMMITVKRLGKGGYIELSYEITLGTLE